MADDVANGTWARGDVDEQHSRHGRWEGGNSLGFRWQCDYVHGQQHGLGLQFHNDVLTNVTAWSHDRGWASVYFDEDGGDTKTVVDVQELRLLLEQQGVLHSGRYGSRRRG